MEIRFKYEQVQIDKYYPRFNKLVDSNPLF